MNWAALKPAKKTEEEIALDAAMAAYEKHFGDLYVFDFGGPAMTMEETTAEIYNLIATDTKQNLISYPDGVMI